MKAGTSVLGRLREERGISTVIAAVSLVALFSAALLSLDFGSMWSSRRNIITATDSTALQQARAASLSQNPSACSANWTDYMYRNSNTLVANSLNCTLHPDATHPGTGYVTVEGRNTADTRFSGLFGMGPSQPYSLSAAEYAFGAPTGLRPMAFCLDNAHVLQWVWYQNWLRTQRGESADPNFGQLTTAQYNALKGTLDAGRPPLKGTDYHQPYQSGDTVLYQPPADLRVDYPVVGPGVSSNSDSVGSYASLGVVHRMFFTKDTVYESGNCGTGSGNWGWMDFNGGSNSNSDTQDWVQNGYDGQSAAGDCNADGVPDDCYGDTGSSGGSVASELATLVDSGAVFYIPIFTGVHDCSGSNCQFVIWGFLPLVLRGFDIGGSQDQRYFDFEFKDAIASSAGNVTKSDCLGCAKVVLLCEVDHDGDGSDAQIASRCGG